MQTIKDAIHNDSNYAWIWHYNISMSAFDEGLDHATSNKVAARFMNLCFEIDMTKHRYFKDTQN